MDLLITKWIIYDFYTLLQQKDTETLKACNLVFNTDLRVEMSYSGIRRKW